AALAQEIREMIPRLQKAILTRIEADTMAVKLGEEIDQFPAYAAAAGHAAELEQAFANLCADLWLTPVKTLDDVVVRAQIAQHFALDWVAHDESDGLLDPVCCNVESLVHVVMAVLQVGGKPFNRFPVGRQGS